MNARAVLPWIALLTFGGAAVSPAIAAGLSARLSGNSSQSSAAEAPTVPDQQYSFAVEIEVVTVPVTVTDRSDEFVTDLNKNDFTILDNGVEQQIEDFELSWEPFSVVILLETSSRVRSFFPEMRNAGILITELILGETGEAAVLMFDREIKLVQGFTRNAEDIESAIRGISSGGDQVRLNDAMTRAISLLQRRPPGRRKVIIVVSEARDHGSGSQTGFVLRAVQQLGISVYTISLGSWKGVFGRSGKTSSSPFPPGVVARPMPGSQPPIPDAQTNWGAANVSLLELITELVTSTRSLLTGNPLTVYAAGTGGEDFSSDGKAKLERALGKIGQELRNQYLLSYRPNNLDNPGFHSLQVIISRPHVKARARPGYMFTRSSRKASPSQKESSIPR